MSISKFKIGIILVILVIILTTIIFICIDGTYMKKKYVSIWDEDIVADLQTDLEKIISGALTAASSHNVQPWLVEIVFEDEIILYADMSKELSVIDSNRRQLLMSQGTFIENFEYFANQYGYRMSIEYAEINLNEDLPQIAHISIEKNGDEKKLDTISSASYLLKDNKIHSDIPNTIMNIEKEFNGLVSELVMVSSDEDIQPMLRKAYSIESNNETAMIELINNFRFTEFEKNKYRYGLSLDTPVLLKPFLQPIIKSTSKKWQNFSKAGIDMFDKRLTEEFAYILLKSDLHDEISLIEIGRYYQSLVNNVNGYELRPAVQIIEELDGMSNLTSDFQKKYGADQEVVLIIGVKDAKEKYNPTLRHQLEDIILN